VDPRQARLLELFQRAQAQVTDRVDAVEAEQWDAVVRPGRDVADLVAHLVGEQLRVPPLLAGHPAGGPVPTDTEELLAGDPLGSWEAAADAALTAFAQPGAVDATVQLAEGPAPATDHLAVLTTHLTVHAWDLARATGGDPVLDADLVAAALEQVGAGRAAGLVDPASPVPAGADPLVRFLAAFDRRA
ncbi:Conserved Hypothetical protein CHP03086, partial [Klenkia terrae]|jgi:uncharacterized protein (TIGR03086 family)